MKKIFLTSMVVVGLSVAGSSALGAASKNCQDDKLYPEISKTELRAKIAQKEVVPLDANSKSTFEENHIPGAIHYGSNAEKLAQVLPKKKDTLLVAYCGGPRCTAWKKAARDACKLGYTQVRHFKGGISGWLAE